MGEVGKRKLIHTNIQRYSLFCEHWRVDSPSFITQIHLLYWQFTRIHSSSNEPLYGYILTSVNLQTSLYLLQALEFLRSSSLLDHKHSFCRHLYLHHLLLYHCDFVAEKIWNFVYNQWIWKPQRGSGNCICFHSFVNALLYNEKIIMLLWYAAMFYSHWILCTIPFPTANYSSFDFSHINFSSITTK